MDGNVTKNLLIILIVATITSAIPIEKREANDSTMTTPSTTAISTSTDHVATSTSHAVEHRVEDIVIHAHEDDQIVSSKDGGVDKPVFERNIDEYIVEPVEQEYMLVPVDDMEVAASGLVFRPLFRYRQKSRRRVDRNTRRRYTQPRPYYRYY